MGKKKKKGKRKHIKSSMNIMGTSATGEFAAGYTMGGGGGGGDGGGGGGGDRGGDAHGQGGPRPCGVPFPVMVLACVSAVIGALVVYMMRRLQSVEKNVIKLNADAAHRIEPGDISDAVRFYVENNPPPPHWLPPHPLFGPHLARAPPDFGPSQHAPHYFPPPHPLPYPPLHDPAHRDAPYGTTQTTAVGLQHHPSHAQQAAYMDAASPIGYGPFANARTAPCAYGGPQGAPQQSRAPWYPADSESHHRPESASSSPATARRDGSELLPARAHDLVAPSGAGHFDVGRSSDAAPPAQQPARPPSPRSAPIRTASPLSPAAPWDAAFVQTRDCAGSPPPWGSPIRTPYSYAAHGRHPHHLDAAPQPQPQPRSSPSLPAHADTPSVAVGVALPGASPPEYVWRHNQSPPPPPSPSPSPSAAQHQQHEYEHEHAPPYQPVVPSPHPQRPPLCRRASFSGAAAPPACAHLAAGPTRGDAVVSNADDANTGAGSHVPLGCTSAPAGASAASGGDAHGSSSSPRVVCDGDVCWTVPQEPTCAEWHPFDAASDTACMHPVIGAPYPSPTMPLHAVGMAVLASDAARNSATDLSYPEYLPFGSPMLWSVVDMATPGTDKQPMAARKAKHCGEGGGGGGDVADDDADADADMDRDVMRTLEALKQFSSPMLSVIGMVADAGHQVHGDDKVRRRGASTDAVQHTDKHDKYDCACDDVDARVNRMCATAARDVHDSPRQAHEPPSVPHGTYTAARAVDVQCNEAADDDDDKPTDRAVADDGGGTNASTLAGSMRATPPCSPVPPFTTHLDDANGPRNNKDARHAAAGKGGMDDDGRVNTVPPATPAPISHGL